MCMMNLNATLLFCSSIETNDEDLNSLIGIYDSIIPVRDNDFYYLDNLNVVLNGCVIFDEKFNQRDDCIQLEKEYEIMVWFTHVESGLGIQIYKSDLCIHPEDLRTWCKDFYEFKRFLRFRRFEIPKGLGNYAMKIFIRDKSKQNSPWNHQSIHSLVIGESRSEI